MSSHSAGTKRGEVEAVRRHVDCCLSVGFQFSNNNIIEKNTEKFQILSDNGPILTLASSARWPSLFERILAVEEGEGAHSEPLAFVWVYTTGNFAKFYDLEEFPYDFPETLHASLYWLVMKKCRRQLFPNWTGCGDRCKKRLFLTPKKLQF